MEVWIVTHSWTRRAKDIQRLKSVSPNKRGGIHVQTTHVQQSCWRTEERHHMILDCCPLDWWQHSFSDRFKCAWMQKHIRTLNATLPMQTNAHTCTHLYLRWAFLLWVSTSQCQSSAVSLRWKFHRDGVELITPHRSVLYYWTKVLDGDNWKVPPFISVFWACFLVNWS